MLLITFLKLLFLKGYLDSLQFLALTIFRFSSTFLDLKIKAKSTFAGIRSPYFWILPHEMSDILTYVYECALSLCASSLFKLAEITLEIVKLYVIEISYLPSRCLPTTNLLIISKVVVLSLFAISASRKKNHSFETSVFRMTESWLRCKIIIYLQV